MLRTLAIVGVIIWMPILANAQDVAVVVEDEATRSYELFLADLKTEGDRIKAHATAVTGEDKPVPADREKLDAIRKEKGEEFVARATEAAQKFSGTCGAVDFLGWVARYGTGESATNALETLTKDHIKSVKLEPWVIQSGYFSRSAGVEANIRFLQAVDKHNPYDKVRAHAIYKMHSIASGPKSTASQETKDHAAARLPEAAQLAGEGILRDRINAKYFETNNLQIGMVAPDIEGTDLDGVEFKLDDYRGKVVVIDFWGHW